ncbi:MBL fold metallo-hydrolase [Candidatus Woesearchaeota archaeon]|nr:MBL fold metallo-hydrolase [Candidatus Woesearchaeota archaeon]
MVNVDIIKLKLFSTNCYVISSGEECILVDPGSDLLDDIHNIRNAIGEKTLLAIIFTHGHYDHTAGGYCFSENRYLHKADFLLAEEQIDYARVNHNYDLKLSPFLELREGEVNFGDIRLNVVNTPGHTMGSVCIFIEDFILTGDTLFDGVYGRTDVGGNTKLMKETLLMIREKFDPSLKIYPGHGRPSYVKDQLDWLARV